MNDRITIRQMKSGDVDEVAKLGITTKELQIDNDNFMYYQPKDILRALRSKTELCLVATNGVNLAGYFLAHLNTVFNEVYISDLVVKPEYRGQGIGQKLMNEARMILTERNIDWSWALVQEDNYPMHKFMDKQGYKKGKGFFFFYKPSGF